MGFLVITLVRDMLEGQSRLWRHGWSPSFQKNGSLDWHLRPGKVGQKFKNMPSLWHYQQKTPYPHQIFF